MKNAEFEQTKIVEKSTIEQALDWWNKQASTRKRTYLTNSGNVNLIGRSLLTLTGREIEEIWKKETQEDHQEHPSVIQHRVNQKQFKKFNPELFINYIDKFSMNDKYNAIATLLITTDLSIGDISTITTILTKYKYK